MKSLAIEHFNGWYRLMPFMFSMVMIEIPFQVSNICNKLNLDDLHIDLFLASLCVQLYWYNICSHRSTT